MSSSGSSGGKVVLDKQTNPASPAAAAAQAAPLPASRADGLALILARNGFYRTGLQRMTIVVTGQAVIIILLILNIFQMLSYTGSKDYFFPIRDDNSLIVEKPLWDPLYTDAEITAWAEKAVTRSLTFGYYDHSLRLQDSRSFFTLAGWTSFTNALSAAQILERINAVENPTILGRNRVMLATIRSNSITKIVGKGFDGYTYAWQVDVQINVSLKEVDRETNEPWKVTLMIVRTPSMDSRDSIGINQILAVKATQ